MYDIFQFVVIVIVTNGTWATKRAGQVPKAQSKGVGGRGQLPFDKIITGPTLASRFPYICFLPKMESRL